MKTPGPGHYTSRAESGSQGATIPKAFKFDSSFVDRVGPGTYKINTDLEANVFRFTMTPRFDMTYIEKIESYTPLTRNLSPDEIKALKTRIR